MHRSHDTAAHDASNTERRSTSLRALLLLNVALLAVLAAVTFGPSAIAQPRASGEFTMVSGGVPGSEGDAVYIVDTVNEELIAVRYDTTSDRLVGIGYRNLRADTTQRLAPGNSR